jgi:predicted outer membrane repeat protein
VPCSAASLGAAVGSAPDSAILVLRPGCVYRLRAALPEVTTNLTIDGNGDTITRQSGAFTILRDTGASLALSRISITNATAAQFGGAGALVAVNGAQVAVIGSSFSNGHGNAGAIFADRGSNVTVDRDRFTGNAGVSGGAIYVSGTSAATVTRSTFAGNTASSSGGAILSGGGPVTVTDSGFTGNQTPGGGGAITATAGFLDISGSGFSGNAGSDGGAIFDLGTAPTFADSRFTANTAAASGGAIAASTYLSLVRDILSGNRAGGPAGAVAASVGRADLIATRVTGNSAATAPGGILAGILSLSAGSIVSNNQPGNCAPVSC